MVITLTSYYNCSRILTIAIAIIFFELLYYGGSLVFFQHLVPVPEVHRSHTANTPVATMVRTSNTKDFLKNITL
jgi:hypothetical protein